MSKNTQNDFSFNQLNDFDIRFLACQYASVSTWNYTDVVYSMWLFYWNPTAGAFIRQNSQEQELNQHHVAIIPPYTKFSTRCAKPFQHFYIHFEVDEPFDRVKREILYLPSDHVKKIFPRFQNEFSDTAQKLLSRILLYEYLLRIPRTSFLLPGETVMDKRIQKATELMNRNLAVSRNNRELCKQIGMSLNNFHHLFLKELGTTPKHYLLNQRMEAARKFLIQSEYTIDEIAAQTGYADRYHFSKAFKRFYSIPPVAYQQKSGKK